MFTSRPTEDQIDILIDPKRNHKRRARRQRLAAFAAAWRQHPQRRAADKKQNHLDAIEKRRLLKRQARVLQAERAKRALETMAFVSKRLDMMSVPH